MKYLILIFLFGVPVFAQSDDSDRIDQLEHQNKELLERQNQIEVNQRMGNDQRIDDITFQMQMQAIPTFYPVNAR